VYAHIENKFHKKIKKIPLDTGGDEDGDDEAVRAQFEIRLGLVIFDFLDPLSKTRSSL